MKNHELPSLGSPRTDVASARRMIRRLVAALFLAASTFYALTQQAPDDPVSSRGGKHHPLADLPGFWELDTNTWEVLSPDGDQKKVRHRNTPDQIRARAADALAAVDPIRFQLGLKKTPGDARAEAEAQFSILHPEIAALRADLQRTPEERQDRARDLQAILNPKSP